MAYILSKKNGKNALVHGKNIITRLTVGDRKPEFKTNVLYDATSQATIKASKKRAKDLAEHEEANRCAAIRLQESRGTTVGDLEQLVIAKTFKASKPMSKRHKGVGPKDWFNALYRSPFFSRETVVRTITETQVQDYANWAHEDDPETGRIGLRNRTIQRHTHYALKQGIELAIYSGQYSDLIKDVWDRFKWPKYELETRRQQDPKRAGIYRKPSVIADVCSHLSSQHANTVYFVLDTGLRFEELMLVSPNMVTYPSEENEYKRAHLCLPHKPFGHTARNIPMPTRAVELFEKLRDGVPANKPMFDRKVARALRRASKKVGLTNNFKLRDMRHCYGTHLAQHAGCTLKVIAELMGNSEATCVKYFHTTVKWNEDAIDKLDGINPKNAENS